MNQDDVSPHDASDERSLRDAGRWARERATIKATCRNEARDPEDALAPMSGDRKEHLVDALLTRSSTVGPIGPVVLDPSTLRGPDQMPLDASDASSTVERATIPPAANDGLGWVRIASHGAIAAAAAAVTLLLVPADPSPDPGAGGHYAVAELRGTDSLTHLGGNDEGYCLDKPAQVRIAGGEPTASTDGLEIVLKATSASGPAHWYLHHPGGEGWRTDPDDGALLFEGPLHDLAALDPGIWTLTVQVGPRGACGPQPGPACHTLDTSSIRIAPPSHC